MKRFELSPGILEKGSGYGAALLLTLLAIALRAVFDPFLGDHLPLVTLYSAIAVAVCLGGSRPALVVMGLGYLVCDWLFIEPRGSIGIVTIRNTIGLLLYLLTSLIIIVIGEAMRSARKTAERNRALLEQKVGEHQAAEERFRIAAEAANAIIYEYDLPTGRVEVARGLEEVLGYRPGDGTVSSDWWWAQVHPDDTARIKAQFEAQSAAGTSIWSEYRVRHKDGRWLTVEDRAVLIKDSTGRPMRMAGCTVDVTGRRREADLLAGQKRILEMVATEAPLAEVLGTLCRLIEGQVPGLRCSILVANQSGTHILTGAGPSLPDEYIDFFRGRAIRPPYEGPCMKALHTGEAVVVADAEAQEQQWGAAWRTFVRGHGFHSCRTMPISSGPISSGPIAPGPGPSGGGASGPVVSPPVVSRTVSGGDVVSGTADAGLSASATVVAASAAPRTEPENEGRPLALAAPAGARLASASAGPVLATFAVYSTASGDPIPAEPTVLQIATNLARIVIDRHWQAAELRAGEERLRSALAAARMVAWEWSPADGAVRVSENAAELFGLPQGAQILRIEDGLALIHPDDRAAYQGTSQQAIESRGSYVTVYRLVRPSDGRTIWIEERGHAIIDPLDGVVRLTGVAADVTARRKAEVALRSSEEKYRTLFGSMDEGFCVIEFLDGPHGPLSDYVHVEANAAYTANAGIPDIVGKSVRELVPEEAEGWVATYRNVLVTGVPVRFERELVATGRHLDLAAFRIEPAESRQVAVLFKDITERKVAEAMLRTSEEQFRTLADNITQFAWMADAKGAIYWYNRRWYDYTGTTPEEMQGWGWMKVHHPDHIERVAKRIQHSWDTG